MDKVSVIQADREAAAAVIVMGGKPGLRDRVAADMRNGFSDDYAMVQAFAKHREAFATLAPDSEKLREAYLVWSNEHQAWWGKDRCGYTRFIDRAGRYNRAEALSIAGTRDGGWHVRKGNPDEIAILERDAIDQYASITQSQRDDAALTLGAS